MYPAELDFIEEVSEFPFKESWGWGEAMRVRTFSVQQLVTQSDRALEGTGIPQRDQLATLPAKYFQMENKCHTAVQTFPG